MTVQELIAKLNQVSPNAVVRIATTITRGGSELTGDWDEDAWADVRGVDDLETKVILTMGDKEDVP